MKCGVNAVAAALLALAVTAGADEAPAPAMYLGPAFYHREGPYRAEPATALMPTGDYAGRHLLIRGDTFGLRLFDRGALTLNAVVWNDMLAFVARDAVTPALRQLDDRDESWNGGLEASWKISDADTVRVAVLNDLLDRHGSALASLHAEHVFSIDASYTQIVPRVHWTAFGADYMDYYFGVAAAEAVRSGLTEQHPGDGSRLDVGLTLVQPLSRKFILFVDGVHKRFDGCSGPLADSCSYDEVSAGFLYDFKSLF